MTYFHNTRETPVRLPAEPRQRKTPPACDPLISGDIEVSTELFKKRVGETAFFIWRAMLPRRSYEGITALTIRRIAGEKKGKNGALLPRIVALPAKFKTETDWGNKHWRIQRALSRLRAYGLIDRIENPVWCSWLDEDDQLHRDELMVRKVFGVMGKRGHVRLPARLADLVLNGKPTCDSNGVPLRDSKRELIRMIRGGKRPGSGPKSKRSLQAQNQQVSVQEGGSGFESEIYSNPLPPSLSNPLPHVVSFSALELLSASSSKEEEARSLPLATVSSLPAALEAQVGSVSLITTSTPLGTTLRASAPRPGSRPFRYIPEPPELSYDSLNPAMVPSPPKLKPTMSEDDRIAMLLHAWRGATQSRFKAAKYTPVRTIDRKTQDRLLEFAAALEDEDISPAGWAAFSCDVWKEHHKNPPRLAWVFMISRLEKHAGWYSSELSTYTGRRRLVGPKCKALYEKHREYRQLLGQCVTSWEEAAVKAYCFPGNLFQQMVATARAEGDEIRTRLAADVVKGTWLWL